MTRRKEWGIAAGVIVLVTGAIVAMIAYNRRTLQQIQHEIYVPQRPKLTSEIELLQRYVRIDTSNPPGNELPGAKFLAALLANAGVKYEIIESAPRRANLYARIKGKRSGEGLILINHIDVVPAAPKYWHVPPFSGAILINMVHGRGSADMKSIALCQLEAFLDVARSRKQPERDLIFLATADEEEGSILGTRWLLEHRPDVFEGAKYLLTEGGVTEMLKEQVTYFGIETGSKQTSEVELTADDEATLLRLRIELEPYFHPHDPDRVLPGVKRFFTAVAPQRIESKELLVDIDATLANGKFWLLPDTMRELLQNSVFMRGVRRLPDGRFGTTVIFSNLPDEDPDRRLRWLTDFIASRGAVVATVKRKEGPAPISPDDTPLFAMIAQEVRRELGDIPVGPEVLGVSTNDARFLRARGMICYGLQPFPLDFFQSRSIHGIDERIRADWYLSGVRLMKRIVSGYAFGPQS